MTDARLWWRAAGALAVFGVLEVVLTWLDFRPDALRLGLLVTLCVATAWLVWDSLGDSGPGWPAASNRATVPPGSDRRLASYVRLLEGHLTADTPDRALRDRLAALCDERLERRHGLRRTDPGAESLLRADLLRDLAGPPRRLRASEIDDYLRRIEDL